jgi:hypothetical protein
MIQVGGTYIVGRTLSVSVVCRLVIVPNLEEGDEKS